MFGIRLRRVQVLLWVLLALSITLAACTTSSADDDGAAADDGETAAASEETDDEAADDAEEGAEELPDSIVFGVIPAEDASEAMLTWDPVREYIEETIGIEVEMQVASDYAGTIEAMRNGHVDFAFFGPFSYVLANSMGAAEILVGPEDPETGENSIYYSVIITHVDSDIHSLEDLVGEDFGFVDPASTSGHLIPELGIIEAGFDPWEDFNAFYAGGHDVVAMSVNNQTLAAGAIWGSHDPDDPLRPRSQLAVMEEAGQLDIDDFRVVWMSEPIPDSPIAVHPDAPQELKDLLRDAFLEAHHHEELLEIMGNPWILTDESNYDLIRRAAEELGLDLEDVSE